MNKKSLRRLAHKLRVLNPWYFFAASLICGVICVGALRSNNITALNLRDEVLKADKAGTDVEAPLRQLREFVYAHMNTNLSSGAGAIKPPIQLKYRYERLTAGEKERISKLNSQIYTEAQKTCEQQFPHGLSGGGRVPCIQSYVSSHGITENSIPDNLYKFDFVSPFWSPDLAGIMMFLSAGFLALFVIRYCLEFWLKAELHDSA